MKIKNEKVIDVSDWNEVVIETYGREYNFQQQEGCRSRGTFSLTVPDEDDDFENDTVPEVVNHGNMGVSFKAWLDRDPKKPIPNQKYDFELRLWWGRNFYPDIQMVANDLYNKGKLDAGEYLINIDW